MKGQSAKRNTKVLFLAPSAYPIGGVATWLSYVLPGLQNLEWEPVLGLACGKLHDARAYVRVHPFDKIHEIINPTGSREGRVRAISSLIRKEKPDLVVSVNIADSFAAVALLRTRGLHFHFAMSLHGLEECYQHDIRDYGHIIDAVIVTNRLTREVVRTCTPYPSERILYAPYGVDVPHHVSIDPPHDSVVRIGYCGRLAQVQKRVEDIPPILAHLERLGLDYTFCVAGRGPDEDSLRESLSGAAFTGKAQFLGNLNQSQLRDHFYSNIDVLLLTSEWETGPIVALEAMSEGILLVSSRYRGYLEEGALESGTNCFLFDIGDCQAAARCILESQKNPEHTNRLRQNALQLVRSRYSIDASINAWDEALNQALRQPIRPLSAHQARSPKGGRLDSLLGSGAGETVRKFLGISFRHTNPGGEWPHSYS